MRFAAASVGRVLPATTCHSYFFFAAFFLVVGFFFATTFLATFFLATVTPPSRDYGGRPSEKSNHRMFGYLPAQRNILSVS